MYYWIFISPLYRARFEKGKRSHFKSSKDGQSPIGKKVSKVVRGELLREKGNLEEV